MWMEEDYQLDMINHHSWYDVDRIVPRAQTAGFRKGSSVAFFYDGHGLAEMGYQLHYTQQQCVVTQQMIPEFSSRW